MISPSAMNKLADLWIIVIGRWHDIARANAVSSLAELEYSNISQREGIHHDRRLHPQSP